MSDSFATPWTVAHQAPLSMELSRQEHWSGLPFPPPRDLPDPSLLLWQADSLPLSHQGSPDMHIHIYFFFFFFFFFLDLCLSGKSRKERFFFFLVGLFILEPSTQ